MGAALASRVLAVAIVRDCFAGREMARVLSITFAVFIIVPVFAPAIGGFFLLSRLGSATPSIGDGYLLDTIAAIVVGGTALTGGVGGAARTLLLIAAKNPRALVDVA